MTFYNFTLALNSVSNSKTYLTEEGDRFKIQLCKEGKNINSARIAEIAQKQLVSLKALDTPFKREQRIEQLGFALTSYLDRVYYSKPWYHRIAAFFGFKSEAEYKIQSIVNQTIDKTKIKQTLFQRFLTFIPVWDYSEVEFATRLLYHKVLNTKTERQKLNGFNNDSALQSIIQDLTGFASTLNYQHPVLEDLISDLIFAHSIAKDQEVERSMASLFTSVGFSYSSAHAIIHKVRLLPKGPNSRDHAVIISGGTKNHAVIYQIQRQENGKFRFTIANTGEGSFRKTVSTIANLIYTDLDENQLSTEFIYALLLNSVHAKKMKDVNTLIKSKLSIENNKNLKYSPEYNPQLNGICTVKSIFALLNVELGQDQHRRFKVYMTEKAIKRFDKAIKKAPSFLTKKETEEIRKEAQEVLAKRKSKASFV